MKTKTITIRLEFPASDGELLRDLTDLHTAYPKLSSAEQALQATRDRLAGAKSELQRVDAEISTLRQKINRGEAAAVDLDTALIRQRRTALLIQPAEQAVASAEADLAGALAQARDQVLLLVNDRFDVLLKADKALIEQMNALDAEMDKLTGRLWALCRDKAGYPTPQKFDQRGRTGELPDRATAMLSYANSAPLEPMVWKPHGT